MSAALLDLRAEARRHLIPLPDLERLRGDVCGTWLGRMVNEHASAPVFSGLARQIRDAGLSEALARECEAFAEEELRHGVLCGAVVESAGGEAIAPRAARDAFPRHEDASPVEALLRNLISVSCLSETAAVALIGAERLRMVDGPLHELVTRIYADEVGHARFGWSLSAELLSRADCATRERLSAYLAIAFARFEEHELAYLPLGYRAPEGGETFGLCSGREARELLYETVHTVMLPGLTAMGLEALRAFRLRHAARLHVAAESGRVRGESAA